MKTLMTIPQLILFDSNIANQYDPVVKYFDESFHNAMIEYLNGMISSNNLEKVLYETLFDDEYKEISINEHYIMMGWSAQTDSSSILGHMYSVSPAFLKYYGYLNIKNCKGNLYTPRGTTYLITENLKGYTRLDEFINKNKSDKEFIMASVFVQIFQALLQCYLQVETCLIIENIYIIESDINIILPIKYVRDNYAYPTKYLIKIQSNPNKQTIDQKYGIVENIHAVNKIMQGYQLGMFTIDLSNVRPEYIYDFIAEFIKNKISFIHSHVGSFKNMVVKKVNYLHTLKLVYKTKPMNALNIYFERKINDNYSVNKHKQLIIESLVGSIKWVQSLRRYYNEKKVFYSEIEQYDIINTMIKIKFYISIYNKLFDSLTLDDDEENFWQRSHHEFTDIYEQFNNISQYKIDECGKIISLYPMLKYT